MEISPDELARKIVENYRQLPENERLLVAIAGPPGSGKSTLAYPLTDALNSLLLHHPPPNPAHIEQPRSLELAEANEQQGKNDEVAICVGLDGWHYSREELDGFEDPKEAHWRRGAAFTFNLSSYTTFLQSIRQPLSPSEETSFPTFDHALKDPAISPVKITSQHRIIIIEGLYCLLDRPGWAESSGMFDMRIWVEVDKQEARERVLKRNFEAGIVEDYKACEERDMANGEEVRTHRVQPDYIITSIQDHPFSREAFSGV